MYAAQGDVIPPAEAEHEQYPIPHFPAATSEAEIVLELLRPRFQQFMRDKVDMQCPQVNKNLALMNPWELPGTSPKCFIIFNVHKIFMLLFNFIHQNPTSGTAMQYDLDQGRRQTIRLFIL